MNRKNKFINRNLKITYLHFKMILGYQRLLIKIRKYFKIKTLAIYKYVNNS